MKLRLQRPRDVATLLRSLARRRPREVEEYLDSHAEEWGALAEATPHDAADILEELGGEAATDLISELDPEEAAEILEELRPDLAADILGELPPAEAASLLGEMTTDEAVDVLAELEEETVTELLGLMDDQAAEEMRSLLNYLPDSAGGLMTTEIAILPIGMTSGEAIERLRQLHEELEDLSYVYIVDDDWRLQGVLSFRDLVFRRPGVGLAEAMVPHPIAVTPGTDREEVAELAQRYHLFGLPVVDDQGRLLGMVTTESVIEAVRQEASEDFAAAVGAGAEETVYTPVRRSVRMRLPWLVLNLALALVVSFVIEHHSGVIGREPVLAALMPVIALLGGNGGFQSLAVVIRALATDDVPGSQVREVLARQLGIGAANGLLLAMVAASASFLLLSVGLFGSTAHPLTVALVMAIAAVVNLTVAGLAGAGIPILLRTLGLDPALASSIFLTLITDLVGFGGFLMVAALLL
ncbi:MAG: magnesium transporter [Acidimicrobiia bacterium]